MRMRRVDVVKAKVDVARNFIARFACNYILSYLSPPFPIILATPLNIAVQEGLLLQPPHFKKGDFCKTTTFKSYSLKTK